MKTLLRIAIALESICDELREHRLAQDARYKEAMKGSSEMQQKAQDIFNKIATGIIEQGGVRHELRD